jgi:hypothetical protein
MKAPSSVLGARANLRIARQQLENALEDFNRSVLALLEVVAAETEADAPQAMQHDGPRLPKGYVANLVRLVFSTGRLQRSRFQRISQEVQKIAERTVSDATLRQTLKRMLKDRELELYSGYWSKGSKMREPE